MARRAVIDGQTVVNVIEADAAFTLDGFKIITSNVAGIGWTYAGGKFSPPPEPPVPVPTSVTNFQARAVMRQTIMPDGRSLFRAVNEDLTAARDALKDRSDSDPDKIKAEIAWQAWEQANEYLRDGPLVMSLAATYGFDADTTDNLFRQASQVIA